MKKDKEPAKRTAGTKRTAAAPKKKAQAEKATKAPKAPKTLQSTKTEKDKKSARAARAARMAKAAGPVISKRAIRKPKAAPEAAPETAPEAAPETAAGHKAPSPAEGPAYRTGYVALIGRPNAGKSTLLNAILGEKVSIVSDKPQTTRISILGIRTTPKGQIIFVDNPGIHKPLHGLNRRMMNFVFSAIQTSDLICLLIDATENFGHGDVFTLETLKAVGKPVFLLINKVDIVRKDKILPIIERYKNLYPFKEIIPISALTGINLKELEDLIYSELPVAGKIYTEDEISDQSDRFLFAELVREKLLKYVKEELPYSTAVVVDSIEDKQEPDRDKPWKTRDLTVIKASIIVDKDNHRRIIIGRQGRRIKQIGIESRQEIEKIIDHKIYLDLHVKVREDWRDAEDVLDLIEGQ